MKIILETEKQMLPLRKHALTIQNLPSVILHINILCATVHISFLLLKITHFLFLSLIYLEGTIRYNFLIKSMELMPKYLKYYQNLKKNFALFLGTKWSGLTFFSQANCTWADPREFAGARTKTLLSKHLRLGKNKGMPSPAVLWKSSYGMYNSLLLLQFH